MFKRRCVAVLSIIMAASMAMTGCSMANKAQNAVSSAESGAPADAPADSSELPDEEDIPDDEEVNEADTEATEETAPSGRALPLYGEGNPDQDEGEMEVRLEPDGTKHAGGFEQVIIGAEKDNADYMGKMDNENKNNADYVINIETGLPVEDKKAAEGSTEEAFVTDLETPDAGSTEATEVEAEDTATDNEDTEIVTPWDADSVQ